MVAEDLVWPGVIRVVWASWQGHPLRPLRFPLAGIDLLAWTKTLLLHGELSTAEPKRLRYRLLHVAARITRSGRRTRMRVSETRPWTTQLAAAFTRLAAPPRPMT